MTPRRVLLDTNLLLLLVVGRTSVQLIARHKRLSGYTGADYRILDGMLVRTPVIMVTPNILTETSNLLRQIGEPVRSVLVETFRIMIAEMDVIDEIYVPSVRAARRAEFDRFGLADTAALVERDDEIVLLTADGGLVDASERAGRRAINFNHHRTALFPS